MSSLPMVAVLGSTIASEQAAELGYGERDLEIYRTSCLSAIRDSGLLPLGLAVRETVSGLELCDVVSGVVILHLRSSPLRIADGTGQLDQPPAMSFVMRAISRHLPVLAIGSGEFLLAAALAGLAYASPGDGAAVASVRTGWDTGAPDPDLSGALGVSGRLGLPMLVQTLAVPSGMRSVASGPDGSVYAVASSNPALGSALSIRWDPQTLPPDDEARSGPFRWLRDQAASQPPRAGRREQQHSTAQGEVR